MINYGNLPVKLDSLDRSHLELTFKWRNDPRIFRWCRQNDLLSESDHNNWFERQSKDPKIKMYVIKNENDKPVGVCGLTDIDLINQRAEFSLYIGPEYHGNGYGKEALKLLCHHAFTSYPLNIIWGESFDGNQALKVFEEIGFKKEGIRRDFYFRNGKFINATIFSLKRGELIS